jgi:hypothetical protein
MSGGFGRPLRHDGPVNTATFVEVAPVGACGHLGARYGRALHITRECPRSDMVPKGVAA